MNYAVGLDLNDSFATDALPFHLIITNDIHLLISVDNVDPSVRFGQWYPSILHGGYFEFAVSLQIGFMVQKLYFTAELCCFCAMYLIPAFADD